MQSRAFPFVHRVTDKLGKRRHYFRRSGQKRVPLPGAWGSPEFQDAYRRALRAETAPRIEIGESRSKPVPSPRPWRSISAQWILAPLPMRPGATAAVFSFGDGPFAALERKHVEPMVAAKASTLHAAKSFLKALRAVVAVALRGGLRDDDPSGIRIKIRATGGFRTWTDDDIAQFEATYPIGSRARLAFGLLLYTGQRRGDVIRMGRQHVKGGLLTVRQAKTGATVAIRRRGSSK